MLASRLLGGDFVGGEMTANLLYRGSISRKSPELLIIGRMHVVVTSKLLE